jgi:hypothetical protein
MFGPGRINIASQLGSLVVRETLLLDFRLEKSAGPSIAMVTHFIDARKEPTTSFTLASASDLVVHPTPPSSPRFAANPTNLKPSVK